MNVYVQIVSSDAAVDEFSVLLYYRCDIIELCHNAVLILGGDFVIHQRTFSRVHHSLPSLSVCLAVLFAL